MKKDILIVDWLLLALFLVLVLSRIAGIARLSIIQLVFMALIAVHILQHWRILAASLKQAKKAAK